MPLASLLKQYSFESDTTRLLTTAFDQAWDKVVASHSPLADQGNADAARLLFQMDDRQNTRRRARLKSTD